MAFVTQDLISLVLKISAERQSSSETGSVGRTAPAD